MRQFQETIATGLLIILTVAGALRMHEPQPFAWTAIWSVCFAFGSVTLALHFLTTLAKEP